ncbi:hypothetical protein B0H67DRAFT_175283 [Lasiosphaeris hirsuta]|uniref:Ser/arg-related nuclear matrix protein n=1 Tax=Lasiosphaeris hirsuta TaxID=260670 RepID=A0AA40AQH2_9PEZI|nr:hypothetical protein B0H67DRAFT_175283 [Lasiosphaeris hirsuta]
MDARPERLRFEQLAYSTQRRRPSMVERGDVVNLLQTGSWKTSRARSPRPYDQSDQHRQYDQHDHYDRADRYEQSDRYDRSPRRPARSAQRARRPPPPSVEDESDSLAREYTPSIVPSASNDEVRHRGDIDQQPIILPVHDHNPERRFVIVTDSETGDDGTAETAYRDQPLPSPTKSDYDGNTCRQYVLVDSDERVPPVEVIESSKKPGLSKRKSRQDLPRLDTHGADFQNPEDSSIRRSNSRRNREKPVIDQAPRESRGSAKPPEDVFLSPVVTHMAGGRERAYLDINPGASRSPAARSPRREDSRTARSGDRRSAHSPSPTAHRRVSSTVTAREARAAERPSQPLPDWAYNQNTDDIFAFMMPGGELPIRGERTSTSSPKARQGGSPPYSNSSRDRLPDRSPSQRSRRQSISREQGEYYGSDSFKGGHSNRSENPRPRRSGLELDASSLLSPEQARPIAASRPGSKNPSPIPSPRTVQEGQFLESSPLPVPRSPRSPRTSSFPVERRFNNDYSSSAPTAFGESPPRRSNDNDRGSRPRGPGRTTSISSIPNGSAAGPLVALTAPAERRPPPTVHEEPQELESPASQWPPVAFDPGAYRALLDQPITSYRRYSEDVQQGVLPQLPECRWATPRVPRTRAESSSFLALSRSENFVICAGCYEGVFSNLQEFKHLFVDAPPQPTDQPIVCEFGHSFWYRMAFLMTLKYRYPDLRLLEGVAAVAARYQSCPGSKPANRDWNTMMAPNSKLPITRFTVCPSCASMIEVILPSLAGIFIPLDPSHTPTRGICALHFKPERKRFLDYFDAMEATADRALSRRSSPKILELADRVRTISLIDECQRNTPVLNHRWHVLDGLPEFTVCEECYDTVIWPMLEEDERDRSDIPDRFIRTRQAKPIATCQLYSNRMREVFRRAVKRDDLRYLETRVLEKLEAEAELKAQYSELMQRDLDDPRVQRERGTVLRKLKEIE